MSNELLVILLGAFVVALAWFLLKFGKVLARAALVAGVIVLAIILSLALLQNATSDTSSACKNCKNYHLVVGALQNATTAKRAVTVATVAGAGAAGVSGVAVLLGGLLVAALGAVGYLAVKVKLLERGGLPLLPRRKKRQETSSVERVVYLQRDEQDADTVDLDLSEWGF